MEEGGCSTSTAPNSAASLNAWRTMCQEASDALGNVAESMANGGAEVRVSLLWLPQAYQWLLARQLVQDAVGVSTPLCAPACKLQAVDRSVGVVFASLHCVMLAALQEGAGQTGGKRTRLVAQSSRLSYASHWSKKVAI
jgi:hypothetical protein